MAKRYKRHSIKPADKRTLQRILDCPKPLTLVRGVYQTVLQQQERPEA